MALVQTSAIFYFMITMGCVSLFMKKIYLLLFIGCALGFGSVKRMPTAANPGAVSTRTSAAFNSSLENFSISGYYGFREDQVIIGKYSFDHLVMGEKPSQKKKFDSLGTGKFKVTQPPGCIHLTRNFFIDEAEITNIDYQEFLFYLKRDSSEENFTNALPELKVTDYRGADYFTNVQYRYFPVVGLSYEQAQTYCQWRSGFVSDLYKTKYKKNVNFKFRLSTEAEWELAASNGLNKMKYNYGVESVETIPYKVNPNAAGFLLAKISSSRTEAEVASDIRQAGDIKDVPFNVKRELPYFLQLNTPYYTYAFHKNDFGIYNMIGNVAEMIEEKGIVKGGSFRDDLAHSKITERRKYNSPTDDIGFRCLCEVEQK